MSDSSDLLSHKLLKIAKADIKASKVLYDAGLHPQSYFYFQQATEKATKAFFLLCEITNPKKNFNVGHNDFKLHSKILRGAGENHKLALDVLKVFPFLQNTTVMKGINVKNKLNDINSGLKIFDKLDQYDLVNITTKDIKKFLDKIDSLKIKYHGIKLPKDIDQRVDTFLANFINEIEKDKTDLSRYFVNSLRKDLADINLRKLIREHFSDYMEAMYGTSYTYAVLYFSSYLTVQHSVISRYPDSLKNPKTPFMIYNKKLPLIKYQPLFLQHLHSAILDLEKLV